MDELLRYPRPVVAVINGDRPRSDRLADALRDCGFWPATLTYDEIRSGPVSMVDFVDHCAPDAVIYELRPPVARRWIGLHFVRNLFPDCRWVLVGARPAPGPAIAGALAGMELVTHPSTIREIVSAVQRTLAG
jgi:hypothetical protein